MRNAIEGLGIAVLHYHKEQVPKFRAYLEIFNLVLDSSVGRGGVAIFGFVELMNLSDLGMK